MTEEDSWQSRSQAGAIGGFAHARSSPTAPTDVMVEDMLLLCNSTNRAVGAKQQCVHEGHGTRNSDTSHCGKSREPMAQLMVSWVLGSWNKV